MLRSRPSECTRLQQVPFHFYLRPPRQGPHTDHGSASLLLPSDLSRKGVALRPRRPVLPTPDESCLYPQSTRGSIPQLSRLVRPAGRSCRLRGPEQFLRLSPPKSALHEVRPNSLPTSRRW